MIVDAFTFYNELDMLECKLEYLHNHIDYFILCECNYTHSGKKKPMYYKDNESRFARFKNKIIYTPLILDEQQFATYKFNHSESSEEKAAACWKLENDQRNHLAHGLNGFPDDTLVIIGDLDEIVSVDKLNEIRYAMTQPDTNFEYMALVQDIYVYNLKYFYPIQWWAAYVCKKHALHTHSPEWLRANARYHRAIQNAGWHLTYFMSPALIRNKIENFAHQEYNNEEFKDEKWLEECIASGKNLYKHDFTPTIVNKNSFPTNFIKIFNKFYPE